mmetsp:Transcript_6275/g.9648  ORF Transcript_6275/g.9648 Transcript_6275/m.9648 type:complete len:178 (-) Transcript_6275:290-823(-)
MDKKSANREQNRLTSGIMHHKHKETKMKFPTKLALAINVMTEALCGINALLRDPALVCSFIGTDPVMVPLFGLTLTSLSVSTLLTLLRDDNLSAITVLSGLCFYHIGVAWLFGQAETAAIDARFPATQAQIDLMGNNGAMYGAVFHLIEGGITIWGLMVSIEQNQSSTSSSDSSKAD